ncbi:MAG: SOS response-associated peptidase family protein, partial [Rhodobacteraceae bacterium]|nr:SOS response-associated peptidase family protein [Paracoccaceae bacterium]
GGYYEWRGEKGAKQPHFFRSAGNDDTLWVAGLASRWQGLLTCTMMTRAANASVEPIHDRMPVILNTEEQAAWLAGSDELEIGAGAVLRHHEVRRFGIADEGADLIEPVE